MEIAQDFLVLEQEGENVQDLDGDIDQIVSGNTQGGVMNDLAQSFRNSFNDKVLISIVGSVVVIRGKEGEG